MNAPRSAPSLPQPLRKLAGRALESALAHVLALDPDTQARLQGMEGRSITLRWRQLELGLTVRVENGRLGVGPADDAGDLRVTATPGAVLSMLLRRGSESAAPGKVEIAGDADLARRLEKLASGFAPDFEEAFTRSFGDVLGVPMARAAREALSHLRDSAKHLSEDGAAWLRDESDQVVSRAETESFLDDVDALRERAERLEARIERLLRQRGVRA